MFFLLCTGIIKLHQVEKVADFFLSFMPLIFVPVGVSLLDSYSAIKDYIVPIVIIIFVSFFICFTVTGVIADKIIKKQNKKEEK